jgi:thiamine pyrophosphate-dependent acetolactate synthase large subunit-like protein
MAKRTAADQFVEILLAAGVRRIYGVVGDSLNPVVDAVRHHDGIEWIHVRHEETGAFAAGAGGTADRSAGGLRGQLWPWQPAPGQWPV